MPVSCTRLFFHSHISLIWLSFGLWVLIFNASLLMRKTFWFWFHSFFAVVVHNSLVMQRYLACGFFFQLWLTSCTYFSHMFFRRRKSFGWSKEHGTGICNYNFGGFFRGSDVFWFVDVLSFGLHPVWFPYEL